MQKHELLNKLYGVTEYETISVSEFVLLANFYNIDFECVIKTPIYDIKITDNICSEINRVYKSMTCRNLISGNKSYQELNNIFKEIKSEIIIK